MTDKSGWTRRDFIKASGAVGGASLISGAVAAQNHEAQAGRNEPVGDELLKGVSDIHIHAFPDTSLRSINELDFARQARDAGYRSVMYKSNDFSCHDRAYLVQQALPDFECFGSLCMNKVHGDKVNVLAAQKAVETSGNRCRCIWMPTSNAVYQHHFMNLSEPGIPVLSESGEVLPEVVKVMEICAQANIIFATGHSSPQESLTMARKAKEIGVKKFVVTHANSNAWKMSSDQIKRLIDLDCFIEYCYITNLWGSGTPFPQFEKMSDEEFIGFVNIAPERSFVTTDLGQKDMPNPLEGMRRCISAMQNAGVQQTVIDAVVRTNPAFLVGL